MNSRPVTLVLLLLFMQTASADTPKPREELDLLSVEHAELRKSQVSGVAYDLEFTLGAEDPEFSGSSRIEFNFSKQNADLTIDFRGGEVKSLQVNGTDVEIDYNGFFITIDEADLVEGRNLIAIGFTHSYSRDGEGLYRFIDPEDGRAYIYSHFEPYNASKFFPGFDQPNLRATYKLKVSVPADWLVISAARENEIIDAGDRKTWLFPRSKNFSTYIFPLHAGQYHVWEASAGDIPLRLFARKSIAEYVKTDEWFIPTQQGFEFFQDYFGIDYPFGKYDQIIVPDFNIGAMENVAAVTFTERFIRRGDSTREDRAGLSSTILHEMSHMWFGDLVTMDWWNGLWLKESVATYMNNYSQVAATEFTDAWHDFYSNWKQSAYRADQRSTTHPVEQPISDTQAADTSFDAITYDKGASVLVQLSYLVGPDAFRAGVSKYLSDYSYGAATLENFMDAIAHAADKDLSQWVEQWLLSSGLNTVAAEYQCKDGAVTKFKLRQSAPAEFPILREHRTQVALFGLDDNGKLVKNISTPVTYSGAQQKVRKLKGAPCPTLVYPNYADWDYVKVELDAQSIETLSAKLNTVDDAFFRSMLWQSLWDMVRDARLPLTEFLAIALKNMDGENNDTVAAQIIDYLIASKNYLFMLGDTGSAALKEFGPQLETAAWQQLENAAPGSDLQKTWLDGYTRIAHTGAGLERLGELLDGGLALPGFDIDQDRRWRMAISLNMFAAPDAARLTEREKQKDSSARGQRMVIRAEASRPDAAAKKKWLDEIHNDESPLSLQQQTDAMIFLFPGSQVDLQTTFADEYFKALSRLNETRSETFLARYSWWLAPRLCTEKSVARLEKAIEDAKDLHPGVIIELKDSHQEDARCVAIGKLL